METCVCNDLRLELVTPSDLEDQKAAPYVLPVSFLQQLLPSALHLPPLFVLRDPPPRHHPPPSRRTSKPCSSRDPILLTLPAAPLKPLRIYQQK